MLITFFPMWVVPINVLDQCLWGCSSDGATSCLRVTAPCAPWPPPRTSLCTASVFQSFLCFFFLTWDHYSLLSLSWEFGAMLLLHNFVTDDHEFRVKILLHQHLSNLCHERLSSEPHPFFFITKSWCLSPAVTPRDKDTETNQTQNHSHHGQFQVNLTCMVLESMQTSLKHTKGDTTAPPCCTELWNQDLLL